MLWLKMYNKAHHSLPLFAGTPIRCAVRRPCTMRYVMEDLTGEQKYR